MKTELRKDVTDMSTAVTYSRSTLFEADSATF
jgi:hypothetical protein